jgi:hypothetical protein
VARAFLRRSRQARCEIDNDEGDASLLTIEQARFAVRIRQRQLIPPSARIADERVRLRPLTVATGDLLDDWA